MKDSVAVIIPAFNEAVTIAEVVKRCFEVLAKSSLEANVIVVDDGSTDGTAALAREAGGQVVSHGENRGVGKAFHTGMRSALASGAEVIVNIDADGQFDPSDIPKLIDPIVASRADFVSASRFKNPDLIPDMPRIKIWGNRVVSRIVSEITGQRFHDVSCGFRAYSREAALQLNLWGSFTYTQESFIDLHIKGMRIEEVPLRIRGERQHGESKVASNLFQYGIRTGEIILHSYRDFWPFRFFGVLSLLCMLPGALLVIFLLRHRFTSGAFTPHIWAGFTGAALFAFGLLILIMGLVAEMLKRIRLNQEMLLYYERRKEFGPRD